MVEVAATMDQAGADGSSVPRVTGRPIRVARIITRLNIGGPAIQAIMLTRDLRACGFHTCLVHGRTGMAEGDITSILPILDTDAVHVTHLVRPLSLIHDPIAFVLIYRVLRRWEPDIVHTHMAKAGAIGRFAAVVYNSLRRPGRRARLVHTYHGHIFEGYFSSRSTRFFLSVERWLARRTDALIAISQRVRTDLIDTYRIADPEQVRLIKLGFNLKNLLQIGGRDRERAKRDLQIPAGHIVVSTVGRLTAIKRHDVFLKAASILHRESAKYLFLVVGDGELRQQLQDEAHLLQLDGCVRFLGWRKDLATIYAATDVFVLTSRSEGTPVALIEAMAAGVASISTDVGGVRDVIDSSSVGRLVPESDAAAAAREISSLAENPELRASLGQRARTVVEARFQKSRLIDEISELYRQLVGVTH